jgi:hypothetical protein
LPVLLWVREFGGTCLKQLGTQGAAASREILVGRRNSRLLAVQMDATAAWRRKEILISLAL